MRRRIDAEIITGLRVIRLFLAIRFLRRVIKRWPAIILAVRRIARVIGRIILLTVSIITIRGIRVGGVP